MTGRDERKLKQLYYTPEKPCAFSGFCRLATEAKEHGISNNKAKKWIIAQDAYTLHKKKIKNFKRRPYMHVGPDNLWQADLADVSNLAEWNDGMQFWLVVIDTFSKFLWLKPLVNKNATCVKRALSEVFTESNRKPTLLNTDKGTEFTNQQVQNLLQEHSIKFYTAENDVKAAIAERVIRTIKERVYRYLTYSNSKRYIDKLQKIVLAYNHAKHRSLGMSPLEVTPETEDIVRKRLEVELNASRPRYQKDTHVRVALTVNNFDKGYDQSWTEEIFKIHKVLQTSPVTYKLIDAAMEMIAGSFYQQEVQEVSPKTDFKVEKILANRTRANGEAEVLVKWMGYPISMSTWELRRNLYNI